MIGNAKLHWLAEKYDDDTTLLATRENMAAAEMLPTPIGSY